MLALPLCLGARSDVLWAPWALVVMTAISLWTHAHLGHRWRVQPEDLRAHALAWLLAVLLVAALSRPLQRFTGAGPVGAAHGGHAGGGDDHRRRAGRPVP